MRKETWKLITIVAALALVVTGAGTVYAQPVAGGNLDPTTVPKYVTPLVIPPAIPKSATPEGFTGDYYEIAVRQFTQHILPTSMNKPTKVWSYCSKNNPAGTLNYPAFTIEATYGTPVRVKWINELRFNPDDPTSAYLPHFLPVDPTLHWANPPQGSDPAYGSGARDTRPMFSSTPGNYTGPVPIVTHVHGAHVADDSDGYAEAWTLPAAGNIPAGYATTGTWYDFFKPKAETAYGQTWDAGSMVFQYPNNQRATTLWYHDHTLGMTRLNVYAGPAGFYIIRGGPDGDAAVIDKKTGSSAVLPGPAPQLGDAPGLVYREIPVVIQDRSFNNDGSLFFPDNRAFFEALNVPPMVPYLDIPFIGANACNGQPSDISPIWNPEFFGNTMVVNGKTWPVLTVEQRRYRFRFLNGCNSRFVILRLVTDGNATAGIDDGVVSPPILNAFAQIGSEGGFLPKVANQSELLIGLAERADTIIDFGKFPVGTELYLVNVGPDAPFGGGVLGVDFLASDPSTTGQVMKFVVGPRPPKVKDDTTPPGRLRFPTITPVNAQGALVRTLSLNEEDSATILANFDISGNLVMACNDPAALPFGPKAAKLGTLDATGMPMAMEWMMPISETPGAGLIALPAQGVTEQWDIYNFTMDAHPIHLHQVMFQVVNREDLAQDPMNPGMAAMPAVLTGVVTPPAPSETGFKDTVIAYPAQVTRIKATFDLPGLYVWHCHIVDHEDNEMMRPYFAGSVPQDYKDHAMMNNQMIFEGLP